VASPLGLRVIVGAEGEEGRDFDFLASVEILVLDQADIFLMQVECNTSFVLLWCHLMLTLQFFSKLLSKLGHSVMVVHCVWEVTASNYSCGMASPTVCHGYADPPPSKHWNGNLYPFSVHVVTFNFYYQPYALI